MKLFLALLVTVLCKVSIEEEVEVEVKKNMMIKTRVWGDWTIQPHAYPYLVRIIASGKDGSQLSCSGSLISHYYVLTAAHCVEDITDVTVYLGGSSDTDPFEVEISCQQCWKKYNRQSNDPDLALIKLSSYVPFDDKIKPVLLPSLKDMAKNLLGRCGTVIGWGRTVLLDSEDVPSSIPRAATYSVKDQEYCKAAFGKVGATYDPVGKFCTSNLLGGACKGDSGGPFVIDNKLFGVVSRTTSAECGSSYAGDYVNVSHFLKWIEKHSDVQIGEEENTILYD